MQPIGKRPYEGTMEIEEPVAKKQKLESSSPVVPLLYGDIIACIVRYLPIRDLIKFSAVAKKVEGWTEVIFSERAKQERFDFSWSCCEKEAYPERASYVLGKALTVYVHRCEELFKNPPSPSPLIALRPLQAQVETLHRSFRGVMKRFPSLGSYIWKDLNSLASTLLQSSDEKIFVDVSLFPSSENAPLTSIKGGDELLKGLSHLTTYCDRRWRRDFANPSLSLGAAFPHLRASIEAKATCAGYLGIKILAPLSFATNGYCKHLAILSASHQDYRGIEEAIVRSILQSKQSFRKGLYYPPILVSIGIQADNPIKSAETFFEKAIKGYGNPLFVSPFTWGAIGLNKRALGKWKEAEEYLEKVVKNTDLLPPLDDTNMGVTWEGLMEVKNNLRKWKEAEKCAEQMTLCSFVHKKPISPRTWIEMAWTQANLNQREKTNLYLRQVIEQDTQDPYVLYKASTIKRHTEQWEQAEEFILKAMAYQANPDVSELVRLVQIKAHLKKWGEAKAAMERVFSSYHSKNIPIPPSVQNLANEINAKSSLPLLNQKTD